MQSSDNSNINTSLETTFFAAPSVTRDSRASLTSNSVKEVSRIRINP
jgi:hypothetical protein